MRIAVVVHGTVQGVGFRPFVRRAAIARGLTGWVRNCRDAVRLEVQGSAEAVASFRDALACELPGPASITSLDAHEVVEREERAFTILESAADAAGAALLPPDLATCSACWAEVRDVHARRYRYPFTNCCACGPRYSIVTGLPYDRPRTSMRSFPMCDACGAEYDDVDDRRHHAQPIACPRCGPELAWIDTTGRRVSRGHGALDAALAVLSAGGVVALRGLGGFQLLAIATDARAVATLRARKRRPHKPFAVMFRDFESLEEHAGLSEDERALLASAGAPIVLVAKRASSSLAEEVAPASPWLGAMIPYTPLHGLLLDGSRAPLVCTSGNLSSEPICTSIEEAVVRLGSLADGFLSHDREVVRPLDDSVARVSPRGPVLLRRARGWVPAAVGRVDARASVLALGAHLKSTVTLAAGGRLVPSQHLGDLDSLETRALLERTAEELCTFFDAKPSVVACDLHPDYASTRLAEKIAKSLGARLVRVQHHHAHVAACMAEHELDGEVLGLAWDGTGYGLDGTIWGGEALVASATDFRRVAHLRPFPLPGGDRASREPRRAALGLLHAALPDDVESCARPWFGTNLPLHLAALERRVQAPTCTSAGRVFDAAAAILGLGGEITYEGQAAIALENAAARAPRDHAYPLPLDELGVADTAPLLAALLADLRRDVPTSVIARRFHEAFVDLGCAIAERAGLPRVVLSGGCFQNRILVDSLTDRLEGAGFQVFTGASIPVNDGGVSVGQAFVASQRRGL